MAENERVAVKRGKKLMNIISQDDPIMGWLDGTLLREYLEIPEEFRVNPFDISPSGDVFWADRRNVEALNRSMERYEADKAKGVKFPTWKDVKKELGL
jgi:hypothetical protein